MCGIVGYIGMHRAADYLVNGLSKLEYRGYDSAGIAVLENNKIRVEKCVGRLDALRTKLGNNIPEGNIGIGHTRWATHGRPSDLNAHPHVAGKFAIVHNGIIENYLKLKEELLAKGHEFTSETDTEVVAHLLEDYYEGDFEEAVKKVLRVIRGSYALAFMCEDQPDMIICTKKDNPLVIGLGDGENFIASDIPAIINETRRTFIMSDGEIATVTPDGVWIQDINGVPISKKVFIVSWNAEAAEKSGYDHFMLKEINEQPKAIRDTVSGRINLEEKNIAFPELCWTEDEMKEINKIFIVACGTAYHAGIVGKYYLEQLARIPVEVDIASEFRYRSPLVDGNSLTIVISQSGETSDTLAALREAKRLGARTLAVTNVVGSSIAREADQVVYTYAGPEIAVASTKAYTTQLLAMLMLSIYVARLRNTLDKRTIAGLVTALANLPNAVEQTLKHTETIKGLAEKYSPCNDVFFLGRSLDYAVALEGALKLKEISYIHAEAYAAGELKHGTLALLVPGVPVIVLATQEDIYDKTISNLQEVKAREAEVLAIGFEGDSSLENYADHVVYIPKTDKYLAPMLSVVPLQLFAYHAALVRGCDVDKPRNLAKSVTVE
ncbi:MAG: glutamine--fructose-6-phosphate transaminase (isomerizing) [Phascolarctobacterium sp.]|nr:glutamine--fructose-6-phosphate transaminase (isomerizing) [Phascolarctobacterium sp.]